MPESSVATTLAGGAPSRHVANLRSGLAAAVTGLPAELIYGVLAVAALGGAYAEWGIRAALAGCVLVTLVSLTTGGNRLMVCGTRPATALILGSLGATAMHHPALAGIADPAPAVFGLILGCCMLGGVFQWAFGLLRFGRVLKYIPFPVTAGLMMGVGLLMCSSSLRPALGIDQLLTWSELGGAMHPASIAIAGLAFALCAVAARSHSVIPGNALALLFGTATHHGLAAWIGPEHLGGTVGALQGVFPEMALWQSPLAFPEWMVWLPMVIPYALTIAALGSIETMLCLARIAQLSDQRIDGDKELRCQGAGNALGGLLGATLCVGNLTRINASVQQGAQSGTAGVAYALLLAASAWFAGEWIHLVPSAVTAGIIIYFAFGMVDDGTRRVVRQLLMQRAEWRTPHYRQLVANALVILLVATVAVLGDMMKAVGIGIAAAMFLFITTSMKPVLRRVSSGTRRHSLRIRSAAESELLVRHGNEIAVLEADGALFFGTADSLAEAISEHAERATTLVLDLRTVTDIDSTGARTLVACAARLAVRKRRLLITGMRADVAKFLDTMGLSTHAPAGHRHVDLDHALQAAEDDVLTRYGGHRAQHEVSFADSELAAGLDAEQVARLAEYVVEQHVDTARPLFHQDDPGDNLFVVASAGVDIEVPLGDGRSKRLVSLAPGIMFGEMALLDRRTRSTTAVLLAPSVVWTLSRDALDALLTAHPKIAGQVMGNISRHLAHRLRDVTSNLDDDV